MQIEIDQRIHKAIAIANEAKNLAITISKFSSLAFPKKMPRILIKNYKYTKKYRTITQFKQLFAHAVILTSPILGAAQIANILSQPIKKHEQATQINSSDNTIS